MFDDGTPQGDGNTVAHRHPHRPSYHTDHPFRQAALIILGGALFFLIAVLTRDCAIVTTEMERMSACMESMRDNFTGVAVAIGDVRHSLAASNDNITDVPAISASVNNIDFGLRSVSGDMTGMVEQIRAMNGSESAITAHLDLMNRQFTDMNIKAGHMAGNVNQMAKPVKMLPLRERQSQCRPCNRPCTRVRISASARCRSGRAAATLLDNDFHGLSRA